MSMGLGDTAFPKAVFSVVGGDTAAKERARPAERRSPDKAVDAAALVRILQMLMGPAKAKPIGAASLACFLVFAALLVVYAPELSAVDMAKLQRSFGFGGAPVEQKFNEGAINNGSEGSEDRKMVSNLLCDIRYEKTNICSLAGDVRVHGKSSTVIYLSTSGGEAQQQDSWVVIKPYPRKQDKNAMKYVREVRLRGQSYGDGARPCTVHHSVPGVLFSTGGYTGNFFHDFNDLLFPLFLTARRYDGDVQFLATNMNRWWVDKYKAVLGNLSRHDIIDFDDDDRVHCFRNLTVGLIRYKAFSTLTYPDLPKGSLSLFDFSKFLKTVLSLDRYTAKYHDKRRPRLLIVARRRTRKFINLSDVVRMSRTIGYEVVAMDGGLLPLADFAQVVNSCDVMLAVHGSGLTNMVFLPTKATVVQVVPWGRILELARYSFFEAVKELELRYMEYSAGKNESSLVNTYPQDHPVFTDIEAIHQRGWKAMADAYLKQDVRVDIERLRQVLLDALKPYQSLTAGYFFHD